MPTLAKVGYQVKLGYTKLNLANFDKINIFRQKLKKINYLCKTW